MITLSLVLEDLLVTAIISDAQNATVTVSDTAGPSLTRASQTINCSTSELGAALALAVGSDEIGHLQIAPERASALTEALYECAEPLMYRLGQALAVEGEAKQNHTLRFIP